MLEHGEVNPLNVFGLRKLDHCPPHFQQYVFDLKTNIKDITDWIHKNLSGRFYVGEVYQKDANGHHIMCMIGFERHDEVSYFILMLDTINLPHIFF